MIFIQDMDVNTFYGRKWEDFEVRAIPTDSEDSELDSDSEETDQEEWIPESGENQPQYSESETEEEQGDEHEEVAEVPHLPRWRKLHNTNYHLLDMIISTTWLLYRRDCEGSGMRKKEVIKLYTFKSFIAEGLCKSGKSLEKKRGRHSLSIAAAYEEKMKRGPTAPIPVPDVRLDQTAHWLIMTGDKGRCRVPRCNGTPKAMCRKCNVHLCFTPDRNCFLKFHTG
ncbi:uncharacterized protein LOC127536019 [Acanthochromis polyacanthus]|uniref:uncharacterized protein LOC127536019 n=1 Tax=Acanthochromis polyacanthus TaxID=80966 RepID=UPI002233F7D4|nr:uncharacterized protein LOC127531359 isoform X1 [Acanthochromis polyacanthus]XP_051811137.1 uncharacterized protein LOC127536019 [Acanthochromis polyacanthus]